MIRSRKIVNSVYAAVFVIILIVGEILAGNMNKTAWEARKASSFRCAEFAIDSFISYTNMTTESLNSDRLLYLSRQISASMDKNISDVAIQISKPEDTDLSDHQILSSYERLDKDHIISNIICRIDYAGVPYYITFSSDFSDVSASCLKTWRIYSIAAAILIIFAVALGIMFNLLWNETLRRKKFMENFTHEMKTPMTSILGYTEMMNSLDLNEEERDKALNALSFEAKRLNSLSAQMLEIFVAQNDHPEMSEISAQPLQEELIISLNALSEKYQIPYSIDFSDCVIIGNKDLLLSMLTNLADNAFKATVNANRKNEIRISGVRKNEKYRISILDHGVGISKTHIDKITEPFYREDKARSRQQGGAGLGLALCSEIAKIHGTKLSFNSKKNKGTLVFFELKEASR